MNPLKFVSLRNANITRKKRWHPEEDWSISDWACAFAGEAGELCNAIKKLRRKQDGVRDSRSASYEDLIAAVAMEAGDTVVYLDLLMDKLGIDLGQAVVDTFNRVSQREGFPDRLEAERTWEPSETPEVFLKRIDELRKEIEEQEGDLAKLESQVDHWRQERDAWKRRAEQAESKIADMRVAFFNLFPETK